MSRAKKSSASSVLDQLDIRPLTDDEIVAMGYDPTPNGWIPFRKDLIPTKEAQPEQAALISSPVVPKNPKKATPPKRTARKGRKGRPARKKK